MTKLTSEILSAFLDGELDPAQSAQVAQALETDPEAVRRLEKFREINERLRAAMAFAPEVFRCFRRPLERSPETEALRLGVPDLLEQKSPAPNTSADPSPREG